MISEERLHIAAEESYALYINTLLSRGDYDAPHAFSPEFEAKIEKLKRNIGKKSPRRVLQKVASFVLAVLVCAGAWLAVDAEARSKVAGWIKEIRGDHFIFHFEGKSDNTGAEKNYRPAWIPEGYNEYMEKETAGTMVQLYSNVEGRFLEFAYSYEPDDTYWFLDVDGKEKISVEVNGCPAELYISNTSEKASKIIWVSSNGTAFHISAFLEKDELIKVAENIRETEEK